MALSRDKSRARRAAREVSAENIVLDDAGQAAAFSQRNEEANGLDRRAKVIAILGVLLAVLIVFGLIVPKDMLNQGLHYSGYNNGYSLSWFVDDLQTNVTNLAALLTGNMGAQSTVAAALILYLVVALTGAGMAMSGAVYQGTFRNALVSPSSLGVISGSMLGMTFYIAFFVSDEGSFSSMKDIFSGAGAQGDTLAYLWASYGLALCSFVGCLLVVTVVVLTMNALNGGKMSGINMILTGQVVGAVCSGVVGIVRYYFVYTNPEGAQAYAMQQMQVSSFYRNFGLVDILAVGIPILACFAVVMSQRQNMMLLTLPEDEARSLGVNTRLLKVLLVAMCTLVTAIIVSFCGHTGFIGFMGPLIARRLVGPNFKYLLPASMLVGAVFTLGAFVIMQMTLGPSYETVTGLFISIFGSIVFIYTAVKTGGGARSEFK